MNFNINLSKSDCDAVLFALSLLPEYQVEEEIPQAQADINTCLCISATKKILLRKTDLTENEWRVIAAALVLVQQIAYGNFAADAADKSECGKYFFTVNSLLPKLPSFLA